MALTWWKYKKQITIDNTQNSNALTDYQIRIDLDNSNFDFSKANSDWSDIRFLDNDDSTSLNYWIESWDSSWKTATIWAKVPSIPASSTYDIYMYYGNSNTITTSDIKNTFEIGDDFNDNSMDISWKTADKDGTDGTSFNETNQQMQIDANGSDVWYYNNQDQYGAVYQSVNGDFIAIVKVISQENTNQRAKTGIMVKNDISQAASSTGYIIAAVTPSHGYILQRDSNNDGYIDASTTDKWTATYPSYLKLIKVGTTFTWYYSTDGSTWNKIDSANLSSANSTQDIGMFVCSHASWTLCLVKFDDFRVRKYTDTEPTTTVGAEIKVQIGNPIFFSFNF